MSSEPRSPRPVASSWPEVLAFYRGLAQEHPEARPLLALVEFLASSRYARSLFPAITHDGLLLGRAPQTQPGDPALRIRFDIASQQFTFVHVQRKGDPNPWSRQCEAAEWQAVLERIFHKRLDWFHEG